MADGSIKIDIAMKTDDFIKEINQMESAAKTGMQKLEEVIKANISVIEKLEDKQKSLTKQIELQKNENDELAKSIKETGDADGKLTEQYEAGKQKLKELEGELKNTGQQLDSQKQRLEVASSKWVEFKTKMADASKNLKEVSENLKEIGGAVTDVGKTLTAGLTAPIMAIATAAIKMGVDFEREMQNVAAITGATSEEMGLMETGIREIAVNSGRSVIELAGNFKMLAEAGGDIDMMMEQLQHGTNLATATQTDMATTLDFLGSVMKTFGLEADATQGTVDSFALVTSYANVELAQIGESFVNVGGSAAQAGMSVDDVNAILITFSNAGLKGGSAGTALNAVLRNLRTPTDKAAEALEELGIALYDSTGNSRDMFDIMRDLEQATGDLTNEQKARYESVIFDSVAQKGWNMITAEGVDVILELSEELSGATEAFDGMGQAAGMAATQQESLSGKVDKAKAGLSELALQIFDMLKPALEEIVDAVSDVINWFLELDDGTKKWIVSIAGTAAAIGPLLIVIGGLISGAGAAAGVMSKITEAISIVGTTAKASEAGVGLLSKAFGLLTNPITIAVVAVAAITYALAEFTPMGDKAYTILVAFIAGLVAFKTVVFVQQIIAGITAATTAYTTATAVSETVTKGAAAGVWLYEAAMKAQAIAHGIAAAAQTAWNTIIGITTGEITLATAAQWLWNIAMDANPVGLIIAGVAALAAGIAFLVITMNSQSEEMKVLVAETETLIGKQTELTDAAAQNALQFESNVQSQEIAAQVTRDLANEIENLAGKQNLTAGEFAYLNTMISDLNDSVPGLTLAYDEQTGALNMTSEALDNYLKKAEAQQALEMQLEESTRLKQEAMKIDMERTVVVDKLTEAQAKYDELTNHPSNRADKKALSDIIVELTASEAAYTTALEDNGLMQEYITGQIETNALAVQEAEQAIADEEAAIISATETLGELSNAYADNEEAAKAWAQAQEDAVTSISDAYDSYATIATNAFSKVKEEAAITVQELTRNLEENARAVEEWSTNLAILTERGVDEGLLQQLRDAGPEAAKTVKELVDASDTELEALNTAFEEGTRVAVEAMKRELQIPEAINAGSDMIDLVAERILANQELELALSENVTKALDAMNGKVNELDFPKAGESMVDGAIKGVDNKLKDIEKSGEKTAEAYEEGFITTAKIHSPSGVMIDHAENLATGLIQGSQKMEDRVSEAGRELAIAFINASSETIKQTPSIDQSIMETVNRARETAMGAVQGAFFPQVGMDIANGVAQGIQSGSSYVSQAAQQMINEALNAMRAAAQIRSPSKKTKEIAHQLSEGLTSGVDEDLTEVRSMGRLMTGSFIEGAVIDVPRAVRNLEPSARAIAQTRSVGTPEAMMGNTSIFASLGRMMEAAVIGTADRLVSGFTQSVRNITNTSSTTNAPTLEFNLYYNGQLSEYDADMIGRDMARSAAQGLRGLGIPALVS